MKTLFIEYIYLSGNSGGVYASRTHINLFAELSEEMKLIYPFQKGKEIEGVNIEKIKTLVPVEDHRSNPKKFLDLLCGKVHRTQSLPEEYFDKDKYDVVVFDSSVVSSGLIKRFKKAGIKTITIHHNYQIEYLKGDSSLLTLIPGLLWTYKYEKEAVLNSDLNVTLTQQDVELLRKHYSRNVKYGVLGVFEYKSNDLTKTTNKQREHKYVITGGLGSKQTENSLIPWIKRYWPLLKEMDPKAELTIAGSNPSERLTNVIIGAGIRLIPSPKDMMPILQESDYYVCPTDCGGGLKLRILDGLKVGLPVLTHDVSARGYERMITGDIVYAYRNEDSFKDGIRKLKENQMSRTEIQNKYNSLYEFSAGIASMKDLLNIIDLL